MEDYLVIFNAPSLNTFFAQQGKEIRSAVARLQQNDLKDDEAVTRTAERLKKQFALEPVVFAEPKVVSHEEVNLNLSPGQSMIYSSKAYDVAVSFPFEGSADLLRYIPTNAQFGGSSRMYLPSGKQVDINVRVGRADKQLVLSEAQSKMSATFELIKINNQQAASWNTEVGQLVDTLLEEQRRKMNDLYS